MNCLRCPASLRSDNASGLCRACWVIDYRERNRECLRAEAKQSRRANVARQLLASARARAKLNGIEFNLVESDLQIPETCPLLGVTLAPGTNENHDNAPSLDRIDPTKGYLPGNVQVISHMANRAKSNLSDAQLRTFCTAVLEGKGFCVTKDVTAVTCPRCNRDGGHEAHAVAPDGLWRALLCPSCNLSWKIYG